MTTEQEIRSWIGGYPRNWDQLCQALMWQLANRFGRVVSTPASAEIAYQMELAAGRIQGGNPPAGSFVYFGIGVYGHVGFVMNDGRVFMATSHLAESWTNRDAGWQSVDAYVRATGARVYGWSYQNGGNTVPFTSESGGTAGGGGTPIDEGEEEMSYLKIVGKAGGWRGGTYAVFANGGGNYSAIFIGGAGPKDLEAVTDEGQIQALQGKISGLG